MQQRMEELNVGIAEPAEAAKATEAEGGESEQVPMA